MLGRVSMPGLLGWVGWPTTDRSSWLDHRRGARMLPGQPLGPATSLTTGVLCMLLGAAGVVADTIEETSSNITDISRRTWTTARETLNTQNLVAKPLNKLLGREKRKGGDHDSDTELGEEGSQALLPRQGPKGTTRDGGSS